MTEVINNLCSRESHSAASRIEADTAMVASSYPATPPKAYRQFHYLTCRFPKLFRIAPFMILVSPADKEIGRNTTSLLIMRLASGTVVQRNVPARVFGRDHAEAKGPARLRNKRKT